jgi:hypothetical protein
MKPVAEELEDACVDEARIADVGRPLLDILKHCILLRRIRPLVMSELGTEV